MAQDSKPEKTSRLQNAVSKLKRTASSLKKLKPPKLAPRQALETAVARQSARRSTTGLQFVLSDRIDFVNPQHWDALAVQTVFLSRDYLRVLEQHGPVNIEPRYALVYDADVPVAALLFQRVSVGAERLLKHDAQGARAKLAKPIKRLHERLLICGNLMVWGARSVAFAPGTDASLLWRGVAEAMYRLRRADKLLGESDICMVKDFAADGSDARDALRLLGYRSVETEPDMVLTLAPEWQDFEDYLASLTANYRSKAKKLNKDCTAARVVFRTMDAAEMQQRQNELHALYEQVHHAQGLRLASLVPSYLPAMAAAMGPRFVCRVAEIDGRLVGFVTSVDDGATALGYYIGFDRETNERAPLYLSLLQSTIDDAIGFGATQLSLGRTALEPKAKLGCKPVPLACAVRHRVSAMNSLVSALTLTASHAEPPERSPFKQTEG
jgi:predicted N-acyltransferase